MTKKIVTLTGPSCSGKSTLVNMLLKQGDFTEIVSTTTRPPRKGEVDGVTYHFVSLDEFQKIEMLETVNFNGNYYGGSVAEFEEKLASNKIPVIIVEPSGMMQINNNSKNKDWTVINLFIDCLPGLQNERFLRRFADDVKARKNSKNLDSLITEYSNRMFSIQHVESTWVGTFFSKTSMKPQEALYIFEFTEKNQDEIFNKVLDKIGK